MANQRNGIVKVVVIVVLAVLLGVAFLLMTREQEARSAAQSAMETMNELIDLESGGVTPEDVREKVGRNPQVTREPGKHRLVEEYQWKGPMGQHTIYAYYTTGATKLLEAVSMNQKLEKWEGDALKVRQE